MKNILLFLSFSLTSILCFAQTNYNLDFETLENEVAKDWEIFGNGKHKVSFDRTISQHGKVSGSIESVELSEDFKALSFSIPANYGGKKIKLTGYIKTENVADGWAGLWMRIDPQVAFDNMQSRGITGTTDWKKYEIDLELNNTAKTIVVGGLLVGTGKMWIDNLEITIDGKSLDQAPLKELSLAEKDIEFDQGSTITFPELNESLISNLELLGKVWGFLKYYHPEIGKGNFNWDYELFRILPSYLQVTNIEQRDNVLLNWINSLGEVKKCSSCKEIDENAILKPDFLWMDSSELSSDLIEKLKFIQHNRFQGNHFYVELSEGVGNPIFKNEKSYETMPYPDEGFRLLTLYKYWNMIQYYYPNKHLASNDWNTILKAYIPSFLNAKNELEFELATIKLIGEIKDTHANLWGGNNAVQEERGFYFPPVHVKFIENKLVVTDYYNPEIEEKIGLQIGDVITTINGSSVEDLVKEKLPFYPASNYPTQLRDISPDLLRSQHKTIPITLIRNEEELSMTLPLFETKEMNYYYWYPPEVGVKSFKIIDDNIGYISLKNIKEEDIDLIKKRLKDTKGIIVDIRNYPSTFVVFSLTDFLNSKSADFVKFSVGNTEFPGEFTMTEPIQVGSNKSQSYKGKRVVVLVNELSQSQAEYTAMALRAGDKTTIVGSTTAGADGNISSFTLPGGMRTVISGIGVYYPDGTETQGVGIIPDVEVLPTIQGIKEGRDEPLEKAIELINKS